jgi:putative ABC transport system ATP-binding protein
MESPRAETGGAEGQPLVRLQGVSKSFRTEFVETWALQDVDLALHRRELVAITGPSGSGKSTLLQILGLLDVPTRGDFEIAGRRANALSFDQRSELRNATIGFVFQSFNLLDDYTVLENVRLPLAYAENRNDHDPKRAEELLDRLGVGHRKRHRPSQLSGGEQQRVAIARGMMMRPEILLLDEPTGNLDAENSEAILALLSELKRDGITIVLVTHEQAYAARADRIVRLRDGRVEANGEGAVP